LPARRWNVRTRSVAGVGSASTKATQRGTLIAARRARHRAAIASALTDAPDFTPIATGISSSPSADATAIAARRMTASGVILRWSAPDDVQRRKHGWWTLTQPFGRLTHEIIL
jgi:hypothetical protein